MAVMGKGNRDSGGKSSQPGCVPIRNSLGFLVGILFLLACSSRASSQEVLADGRAPQRMISLAPVITETLFALGAGRAVCGVTSFCTFPAEAARLPKVGGFYDSNYETIVALQPDLVVLLAEHAEHRARLQTLHLPVLTVEMHSLAGTLGSFVVLGGVCHRELQAAELVCRLQTAVAQARALTLALPPKRVMVVVGRDYGSGQIREVYIAGQNGFYNELLFCAGGMNTYTRAWPRYPKVSAESILKMDPEVIIDVIPDAKALGVTPDQCRQDWSSVPGLRAAQTGSVYILSGSHAVVPGPRLPQLLKDMGRILHPEVNWE